MKSALGALKSEKESPLFFLWCGGGGVNIKSWIKLLQCVDFSMKREIFQY